MSGALMALAGATGAAGGGGSLTLAWASIYGLYSGSNAALTVSGVTGAVSLEATITGGASLFYVKNGTATIYSGAFTVANGDTLGWLASADGSPNSGTVTVTNQSDGGATVGTFSYLLRSPPGEGHE